MYILLTTLRRFMIIFDFDKVRLVEEGVVVIV